MSKFINKLPIPIVGLMLALGATGNLVLSYGNIYRNIFGCISGIILLLVLIKIILYPKEIVNSLDNPVVASVFPTLSMGIMILSTYLRPWAPSLAYFIWIIGLVLHCILIIYFTKKHVIGFNIKKVFPSWFIVYVGIVVGSVTAPTFGMEGVGKILFWFGLVSYFLMLPIVTKRVFKVKEIPEPALPTLVIYSAPGSLCLAGYMSSFQDKSLFLVYFLLCLSQLIYLLVLIKLPSLLKLKFYPSYSAFTFPLVITGISLKLTNGFLTNTGRPIALLKYLVKFEEFIAVAIVLYVLIKYIGFQFGQTDSKKTA